MKHKSVILIDCHDAMTGFDSFDSEYSENNVLRIRGDEDAYIEPLLSALREYYDKFEFVCLATNSAVVQRELACYFPELFEKTELIAKKPLLLTDVTQLTHLTLPYFKLELTEPVVSEEFEKLKSFFMLDERVTDVSENETIQQLTENFISRLSCQQCTFSAFVQIRLLSFYAGKLNKYGDAYFKSLSVKCGDGNVSTAQLWQLISDKRYSVNERFFIYNQILSMEFGGVIKLKSDFNIRFKAYKNLVESFAATHEVATSFIPATSRNSDIVFVFIAQFLSPRHAPSKIALDIIKGLCLSANKQVVLIDTCELLPRQGAIPWYDSAYGNRGEFQVDTLTFEGASFNYLQLSAGMPNRDEIGGLIDLIKNYKPYFVITVGESITADICSQLVPNVVVPTIARLPHTLGQFRLADASILPDNCGIISEEFHQGILDFRVVPEIAKHNQLKSRLNDTPLRIAIVGNRLDAELESSFFDFLLELGSLPVKFVFVGEFSKFTQWCARYPTLQDKSEVLGYQSDLVQALSQFDVFLNYPRMGGGNSALYAMRAGLPVLTLKQGDVYAVAGKAFGLDSYFEIEQELTRMIADSAYLNQRSELASSIAAEIVDERSDINNLIGMLTNNPLFNRVGFVQAELEFEGEDCDKNKY